jgi:hypothetical protein
LMRLGMHSPKDHPLSERVTYLVAKM